MKSVKRKVNLPKNSLGLACLNAGCGSHYLEDWINLDFYKSEHVQYCDLRKGIPYPDNTFDVVYSSNVIEHFSYKDGQRFLRELFRVLKTKGTIRLLTPDLERIAREYLANLNALAQDKSEINRRRYEWILLEMFDQMTREKSGGLMLEKVQVGDVSAEYVISRTGDELRGFLYPEKKDSSFFRKLLPKIRSLVGRKTGKISFRESGELHKWYYDRVSLEYLFRQIGFVDFQVVNYKASRIPGWGKMNLDISASGDGPRKPDSIIVEGSKKAMRL